MVQRSPRFWRLADPGLSGKLRAMKEVCGFHPVRLAALVGVAVWGWYVAAMFRTMEWGYDRPWREIGVASAVLACSALVPAMLLLLDQPWRRHAAILALGFCTCLLTVEGFARSQEYLFKKQVSGQPASRVTEVRWWPFAHHSIGFAGGQWWGCD